MRYNRKSVIVSASTDDPVISTADMRDFLRITGTDNDTLIAAYVSAATEAVKEYCQLALRTETLTYRADGFPGVDYAAIDRMGPGTFTASVPYVLGAGGVLDLPYPPLQSVTSIKTYDRSNSVSTFDSAKYQIDLQTGRIFLNEGETWPSDLRAQNAVEVVYVAGYGAASVPAPIGQAIRLYVANMFDGCDGMTAEVTRLLAPYRRMDQLAW